MNDMPLISVIVPVYGVAAYLPACLDSLFAQTHTRLEIIAVDDGSPDRSGEILDAYAARDGRLRVIHQANGGLSAARNAGIAAATGEYLGFLDGDDTAEPGLYEALLLAQRRDGTALSVCGFFMAFEDGRRLPVPAAAAARALGPAEALAALIADAPFKNFVWNKLFRRELFEGLRFPVGKNFEDIPLMYRLFERAGAVSVLPDCLVNYLQRSGSIVGKRRLGDELDGCMHHLLRYEDLALRQPRLEPLLLYCLFTPVVRHAALVGLQNPPAAHRAERERKRGITAFLRARRAALSPMLGGFDRLLLGLLLLDCLLADYLAGGLAAAARALEKLGLSRPRPVPETLFPKEDDA